MFYSREPLGPRDQDPSDLPQRSWANGRGAGGDLPVASKYSTMPSDAPAVGRARLWRTDAWPCRP